MYEIELLDLGNSPDDITVNFVRSSKKIIIAPPLTYPVKTGELLIRRYVNRGLERSAIAYSKANCSFQDGWLRVPNSALGMLVSFGLNLHGVEWVSFYFIRRGALSHSHECPSDGRDCGRLGVGLFKFIIEDSLSPEGALSRISSKQKDMGAPAKGQTGQSCFSTASAAVQYTTDNWKELTNVHNIAVPRDVWRFNLDSFAELYVSVERMFLSEYDDDEASSEEKSHRFIDVLDIVVRRYTNDEIIQRQREQTRERTREQKREHRRRKRKRREQRRRKHLVRAQIPYNTAEENGAVEGNGEADSELVHPTKQDGTINASSTKGGQQRTTLGKSAIRVIEIERQP
jgi:hypothetical protein